MKRSLTLALSVPVALALTSCSAIDSLEDFSLANYQRRCDRIGFTRGTDAFANCMLQQQAMDEASDERQQIIRAIGDR